MGRQTGSASGGDQEGTTKRLATVIEDAPCCPARGSQDTSGKGSDTAAGPGVPASVLGAPGAVWVWLVPQRAGAGPCQPGFPVQLEQCDLLTMPREERDLLQ